MLSSKLFSHCYFSSSLVFHCNYYLEFCHSMFLWIFLIMWKHILSNKLWNGFINSSKIVLKMWLWPHFYYNLIQTLINGELVFLPPWVLPLIVVPLISVLYQTGTLYTECSDMAAELNWTWRFCFCQFVICISDKVLSRWLRNVDTSHTQVHSMVWHNFYFDLHMPSP